MNFNDNNFENEIPPVYLRKNNSNNNSKPMWAAVTGFVLSIVNLLSCCCCTIFLAPVSLVMCIVSLVKKWGGKGLAISGIVISSAALIYFAVSNILYGKISREITDIIVDSPSYAEEYRRTGEIPSEYRKYTTEEYEKYWEMLGFDSFEDFYETLMDIMYPSGNSENSGTSEYESDEQIDDYDFYSDYGGKNDGEYEFGEELIDI